MKYFRYFAVLLVLITFITFNVGSNTEQDTQQVTPSEVLSADISQTPYVTDSRVDYDEVEDQLAELRRQLSQPDILRTDIIRGWYLSTELQKKYGTPETWVFVEDGVDSKWISPNVLDEVEIVDSQRLCKQTAGRYFVSCLDTSSSSCDFVPDSYCECSYGSRWHLTQGCVLTNERDAYIAINAEELSKGWYFGLPNEKKLNTPLDWTWQEAGRKSVWQKTN